MFFHGVPMSNPICVWVYHAAMTLPRSAFIIVSHILSVGTPFPCKDGSFVIAACLSYRTLQRCIPLTSHSVSKGITVAVRSGWLIRTARVAPTVPAIYAVPA